MTATIPSSAPAPSSSEIAALAARLRGPLLRRGDPGYDEARAVWNGMIDRRPALVVRCLGTADVVACVEFARASGLTLSVKGGGHNISGLAVCDGGLLLDMSLMRGVWVDPATRTARAQSGCLLGDVDRETQLHGLAAPLGFVSTTGIAGLTLGGGFGYLTRRHGWTSDGVQSVEIVTADARVVRASERADSELLWALRGGGGNFGVATAFEYRVHPVGPEITAGAIAWRERDAPEILELYRGFMAAAPLELTCIAVLRRAPPAPWLPPAIHGQPIVALFACHIGPAEEGAKQLAPIKRHGSPVGDIIQPRPYLSQQSLLDATQPKGRRYYWKSEYLATLDQQLLDLAMEQAQQMPSPHSSIVLFSDWWHARSPAGRPLGRGQSGRGLGAQHHGLVGRPGPGRSEHRVGAHRLAADAFVLHRRDVHQLSDGGGGRSADSSRLWGELRPVGVDQAYLGSGQPLPRQQEHRAASAFWTSFVEPS